jgi:hypothetical protein
MSRAATQFSPARFDVTVLPGAKMAPFPGFVEPCHPTLRGEAPSGERWIHEIKFEGYPTQAYLQNREPAVYTLGVRLDAALPADRRWARSPAGYGHDPGWRSRGRRFAARP